jgi:hypothetical protein
LFQIRSQCLNNWTVILIDVLRLINESETMGRIWEMSQISRIWKRCQICQICEICNYDDLEDDNLMNDIGSKESYNPSADFRQRAI